MSRRLLSMDYWRHRTLCDVLSEMRDIVKVHDSLTCGGSLSTLASLIEEAQSYANKMEAGLEYKKDIEELHEERKKLIKEIKYLADLVKKDDKDSE